MGRVLKFVVAFVAGFALGALFVAELRNASSLRTSGSSTAYSVYVQHEPDAVFDVLADIDAWPNWLDGINKVTRSPSDPGRVTLVGRSFTADFDVIIDDYGSRIQLTALPAGDLTQGKVTIQVEPSRREHSRITVVEYIQLQRRDQIGGNEHSRYELFRGLPSSIDTGMADPPDCDASLAGH